MFQNEEWEQFQSDLLMTVRVANDLKTEAQTQSELLIAENKELKERITNLEAQIDKLKGNKIRNSVFISQNLCLLNTVFRLLIFSLII